MRRNDLKSAYRLLTEVSGRKSGVSETIVTGGVGVVCADYEAKMETWAAYFESLLNRPPPADLDAELQGDIDVQPSETIDDSEPTMEEVEKATKRLKLGKAAGPDLTMLSPRYSGAVAAGPFCFFIASLRRCGAQVEHRRCGSVLRSSLFSRRAT
jgi:hypothetical protein